MHVSLLVVNQYNQLEINFKILEVVMTPRALIKLFGATELFESTNPIQFLLLNTVAIFALASLSVAVWTTSMTPAFNTPSIQENEAQAELDEAKQIEEVLAKQTKFWNEHNIEGFMETYWNSDKMTFSGGGKTRRGWQATLDSYKKSYPGEKMGKLHFDGLEVELLSNEAAFVLGYWHLEMDGEKKDGNFTLVLKKLEGDWKIVHDHSSTDEPDEEKTESTTGE
jgi:ketosteroid isomerase-like protein